MPQYAAVRIEYLGFGDKSHIFVTVYHRQVPGICLVEFFITSSMESCMSIRAGGIDMNLCTCIVRYRSERNIMLRISSSNTTPFRLPSRSTAGKILRCEVAITSTISLRLMSGLTCLQSVSITLSTLSSVSTALSFDG